MYPTQEETNCPVNLTERYFQFLGTDWTGSVVPLSQPGHPDKPHATKVMSYTNAIEDLQHVLQLIGLDPNGYSEHSMKRGGATEAARRGASAADIQLAGNWSDARVAGQYVDHPAVRNQALQRFLQ